MKHLSRTMIYVVILTLSACHTLQDEVSIERYDQETIEQNQHERFLNGTFQIDEY